MATDTQALIDKLEEAYGKGATKVRLGDEEITFASGDDLLKRIKYLKRQLNASRPVAGFASFSRGEG